MTLLVFLAGRVPQGAPFGGPGDALRNGTVRIFNRTSRALTHWQKRELNAAPFLKVLGRFLGGSHGS